MPSNSKCGSRLLYITDCTVNASAKPSIQFGRALDVVSESSHRMHKNALFALRFWNNYVHLWSVLEFAVV